MLQKLSVMVITTYSLLNTIQASEIVGPAANNSEVISKSSGMIKMKNNMLLSYINFKQMLYMFITLD